MDKHELMETDSWYALYWAGAISQELRLSLDIDIASVAVHPQVRWGKRESLVIMSRFQFRFSATVNCLSMLTSQALTVFSLLGLTRDVGQGSCEEVQ
jgi:hypothetical protein